MYTKGNILVFSDDDEFYEWCVNPELKVVEGKSCSFTTWDFSYNYQKALKEGKKFTIYDSKSNILKNGAVSYRTITRKVDNLIYYNNLLMSKK